jgi:hypothetical protein
MLRGGWANSFIKSKEGTAVGFLLAWCGRSDTTLVAVCHIHKNATSDVQPEREGFYLFSFYL